MIIKFYLRKGINGEAVEVAQAQSKAGGLVWSGDSKPFEAILKSDKKWFALDQQPFDEDNPEHVSKIPYIFAGSYCWAIIESDIVGKASFKQGSGNWEHKGRPGKRGGSMKLRIKGGPGSGNIGHEGRPGLVGGSAPSGKIKVSIADNGYTQEAEDFRNEVKRAAIRRTYAFGEYGKYYPTKGSVGIGPAQHYYILNKVGKKLMNFVSKGIGPFKNHSEKAKKALMNGRIDRLDLRSIVDIFAAYDLMK